MGHKKGKIIFILNTLVFILFSTASWIYPAHKKGSGEPLKIGLALSGGGAKGLAHIGVLKVLDEVGVPIDAIAGTSMGALVGGLYAIGYTPEKIAEIATHLNWQDLLTDAPDYRLVVMAEKPWHSRYLGTLYLQNGSIQLPAGLVSGQRIATLLSRLTWPVHHVTDFTRLPIPFVCVATDIITGKAVPLQKGFLPEALRASMAIPTIFAPLRLNGQLLVDGGLVRNLPAQDVRDLGANFIIGVDVGAPLRTAKRLGSFLEIMDQSLSLQAAASTDQQRKLSNILIVPDLGSLDFSDFDRARELINRGEAAARKILPQLKALADSARALQKGIQAERASIAQIDSIFITDLAIKGVRQVSRGMVQAQLGINPPVWVTAAELEQAIDRVYSSQFFDRVTYRLSPGPEGTHLTIQVLEKSTDLFNFSVRYDDRLKATLLFNLTFRNLTGHNSALAIDLKLGGKSQAGAEYFVHTGLPHRLGVKLQMSYSDSLLDLYKGRVREARLRIRSFFAQAMLGTFFSSSLLIAGGFKYEHTRIVPYIGQPELNTSSARLPSLLGQFWIDTRNRSLFPNRGQFIRIEAQAALRTLGNQIPFQRYFFDWQSMIPVNKRFSFLVRLLAGWSKNERLPLYYQYFLGGAESFVGLEPLERSGPYVQAFQFGMLYEIFSRRFVIFRWNIGNTFDSWKWPSIAHHYLKGAGLTLGALTPLGPFEWTIMGGSKHALLTQLNFGFKF